MRKFTILEIEAIAKNACPDLIAQIRDVQKQMKDCRTKIVDTKRLLKDNIQHFNKYVNDYAKYIAGKSLQNPYLLNYTKRRIGNYEVYILDTRFFLKKYFNQLYKLREQNRKLFCELLDFAVEKSKEISRDKSVCDQNKKIVLNRVQARTVFNKLYDFFDTGKDFEKVVILIGRKDSVVFWNQRTGEQVEEGRMESCALLEIFTRNIFASRFCAREGR